MSQPPSETPTGQPNTSDEYSIPLLQDQAIKDGDSSPEDDKKVEVDDSATSTTPTVDIHQARLENFMRDINAFFKREFPTILTQKPDDSLRQENQKPGGISGILADHATESKQKPQVAEEDKISTPPAQVGETSSTLTAKHNMLTLLQQLESLCTIASTDGISAEQQFEESTHEGNIESGSPLHGLPEEDEPSQQIFDFREFNPGFSIQELKNIYQEFTQEIITRMNKYCQAVVSEKLIVVLDRAKNNNTTGFKLDTGAKLTPLSTIKHCFKVFLNNIETMDCKREIALITMNKQNATWEHGFSNAEGFLKALNSIKECKPKGTFNVNTVFDLILKHVKVCEKTHSNNVPAYFVRVLFLYGRSNTALEVTMNDGIRKLLNSPYFIFDTLVMHEPVNTGNNMITDCLENLDPKGSIFSVRRNINAMYLALATSMLHPLCHALEYVSKESKNQNLNFTQKFSQ